MVVVVVACGVAFVVIVVFAIDVERDKEKLIDG